MECAEPAGLGQHARTHTRARARRHARTLAQARAHTQTHTHADTHADTHARMHTHARAHARAAQARADSAELESNFDATVNDLTLCRRDLNVPHQRNAAQRGATPTTARSCEATYNLHPCDEHNTGARTRVRAYGACVRASGLAAAGLYGRNVACADARCKKLHRATCTAACDEQRRCMPPGLHWTAAYARTHARTR